MQPAEAGQEKSNLKKKKTRSNAAVERGILIHRFFEYLPQLPEGRRYEAACQMVKKEGLTQSEWEGDIEATLKMLNDVTFKEIFGPGALAEVPVSGLIDGLPFQGRIDRLLVTPDQITIVDYKTDRNPPLGSVPDAYVEQLESYAVALRSIYPNHKIRKILLWTTGPKIQEIE
jgi:ATP-dependent helicase/nuclease subunit A